jgi:type I restriction enzyme S subunit
MNWERTKLSDFLTDRDGRIKYESANRLGLQRIKKIDFSGNIHLDAETDTKTDMIRVKSGDLIISGINAAKGAIAVHGEEEDVLATIHYSAYEFNSDRISVDFLKWLFKSPEFSELLKEQIPGGIKTELKPKHILPLQVKLPKLSEQITVADRLNRFRLEQLKIEHEITHQESLLAKLKQAILQEAIQGGLTADWRAVHLDVEPASQLLQRITKHRLAEFETALAMAVRLGQRKPKRPRGLVPPVAYDLPDWPDLPSSWIATVIDKVGMVCVGSTPDRNRKEFWGGSIPWVSSGEVANCFIHDTQEKISEEGFNQASVTMHPPGTVLIAMIGQGKTRGQSAVLKIAACTNQNSASVVIDHGLVVPEFLWMVFLARYNESREAAKGGNQPALNGEVIGRIALRLPPLAEQAAIVARVEALMTTCRALEAEIEHSRTHAAHLLQAVLKEAFAPASL